MKEMTKEIPSFSFHRSSIGRLNPPMKMHVYSTIYQLVADEPFSFLIVTKGEEERKYLFVLHIKETKLSVRWITKS